MPACPLAAQCSDSQEPQATADSLSARAQGPLHAEQRPLLHSRAGRSLTPAALPLLRRTPSSAAAPGQASVHPALGEHRLQRLRAQLLWKLPFPPERRTRSERLIRLFYFAA